MLLKMHPRTSSQLVTFTLKTISAAVFAATLVSSASAAGLGRLTVLSALGQPLNAEIELTSVGKDEAGTLSAKLASAEAFRQANIEFNPALFSVRFGIEQRGARQFIRVTSSQPINEPYVDMLLELGGTSGRLVREYTFLLDPVDLRSGQITAPIAAPIRMPQASQSPTSMPSQPSQPSSSSNAASPAVRREPAESVVSAPRPVKVRKDAPASNVGTGAGEKSYTVKSGDSLARIANKVRSGSVSLDQMLVALYRANPSAFVGENMNRMRAGEILSVPTADSAKSVDGQEARGVVVAQAQDFSNYRNKLAGKVSASVPQRPVESKQVAGGKITTKVEEAKNPADESKDKLKLSKTGTASTAAAIATARGANVASAEEKIAKDKSIAEANSRVKDLEKNVADLQKVLEVKNRDLADQQKKADLAAKTAASAAAAVALASKPGTPLTAVTPARSDIKKPDVPLVVTPPVVASAVAPVVKPTLPVASTPAPVAPNAATVVSQPTPTAQLPVSKTPAPPVKAKPAVLAPVETSFLDDLLGNALLLPALGLLLVGLGAFGIFSSRRKKKNQQFEDSILTDSNLKANSLFGSTGGQSVDTNNSVFNSNFAPSASQLDANEVDPVAEADVYIAYGRDAQAEEILKEALRTQPDRNAVRIKLLEIYAHRKDVRSFELMASDLYGMTKGQGDDWAQAASMGIALDPNNPMYAGGQNVEHAMPFVAPVAPVAAADDLDLEALLASTQINTLAGTANTIAPEVAHLNHQDLDLNTASYLDSASAKTAPQSMPVPKTDNGLDFDLEGMGIQDVESHEVLTNPSLLTADAHNAHAMDFESPTLAPEQHIDAVDFTETEHHAAPAHDNVTLTTAETAAAAIAANALHFEIPETERVVHHAAPSIPVGVAVASAATPAVHPNPMDFDLSGISLDLDPDAVHGTVAVPASPAHHATHDTALENSDTLVLEDDEISSTPEMATKLDLAIAYEEIGDKDGARELLDEVIKGGTTEQATQAKAMLAKLA